MIIFTMLLIGLAIAVLAVWQNVGEIRQYDSSTRASELLGIVADKIETVYM
jgi:hypothetical protein